MDLWVRLGINLPLCHFVRELCGDLNVVIDEEAIVVADVSLRLCMRITPTGSI